jgi:UDP-N-acetylmuramate--alanine ligase
LYPKFRKFHLIGIGGIGMSGIAQLLQRHGYDVAGSDLSKGDTCRALEAQGMRIFLGHHAANVESAEVVVYSSAVSAENPELVEARKRGIPCIARAEMLAELMRLKYGIAIAGAHGKTTTTSMAGWILRQAGLDPTIVVGGRMDNFGGTNACLGQGEFMVVEADESDGSFNRLTPSIAIVTNLDNEHLDHYGTFENVIQAFQCFLEKIPFYGVGILCSDDERLDQMGKQLSRRIVTYGFNEGADYQLSNYRASTEGCSFEVTRKAETVPVSLAVVGRHNALNAVASLALADELGIGRKISLAAVGEYRGVQRRFQFRGEKKGIRFYDDYAHHPTEIRATLLSARERFPNARVRVLFQPHRYSRVRHLWSDFSQCFTLCNEVAVTPVYAAGELPLDGINSERLASAIRSHGPIAFETADPLATATEWLNHPSENDVVLTLGAGDLPKIYAKLF